MEWNWVQSVAPSIVTGVMLGIPAFFVWRIQREKRNVELHKIGKLSDTEWELLDIAMRNNGVVEWGWLAPDKVRQDLFVLREKDIDAEGRVVHQSWSAGHYPRFGPALARLVLYGLLTSPSEDRLARLTVYGITEYYIQRGCRNDGAEGAH